MSWPNWTRMCVDIQKQSGKHFEYFSILEHTSEIFDYLTKIHLNEMTRLSRQLLKAEQTLLDIRRKTVTISSTTIGDIYILAEEGIGRINEYLLSSL